MSKRFDHLTHVRWPSGMRLAFIKGCEMPLDSTIRTNSFTSQRAIAVNALSGVESELEVQAFVSERRHASHTFCALARYRFLGISQLAKGTL